MYTQDVTARWGQTLGMSSTYESKKRCPYQCVWTNLISELQLIFHYERTLVCVLFNEVLSIFLVSSVLFTDEARFNRDDINIPNQQQWAEENPHCVIHPRHRQQFSINVRAQTVSDCLVWPHVLPHQLTCYHYWEFLLHDLPKLLDDVSLANRTQMWYM
jgi:hypothetical protein